MAQLSLVPRKPRSASHNNENRQDRQQISPMRLVLHVVDGNQIISAQLREQLVVGRGSGNTHPDIDLTALDSGNFGISRQHALFLYDNATLFVEDLHSTNGTRINGYTIDAGKPYILHNGDEVEFGSLRMSVRLVRTPT
jgi:pSer/pThr/pTyr-binding forkhead associated (FHA) protein